MNPRTEPELSVGVGLYSVLLHVTRVAFVAALLAAAPAAIAPVIAITIASGISYAWLSPSLPAECRRFDWSRLGALKGIVGGGPMVHNFPEG